MKKLSRGEFNRSPKAAYMGFLFQTFLKRPFGYIVGILYVIYLAIILLIVPAAIKQHPLFIWNISTFNMPIFNLFFIAAETSAIAVAIFRTGRDDGTDLTISAKPLTKSDAIGIKTATYIIIMLIFCFISILIAVLILPIFGQYDLLLRPTGIAISEYRGIILSMLTGNIVNMFLFGGLSVFISLVGGQVITMIGTISLAFLISLLNFIYPMTIKSPYDVINNDFNTSMLSYKANTLAQYKSNQQLDGMLSYCAVECHTDESGDITSNPNTKETWDSAVSRSGNKVINFIDIGKQLSTLYTAFGLEGLRLEDAKQLPIGTSVEYDYLINESTHVDTEENIIEENFPLCVYDQKSSQGVAYPIVRILGGSISDLNLDNWYVKSKLLGVNADTISIASFESDSLDAPTQKDIVNEFSNKWSHRMDELYLSAEQKALADAWWNDYMTGEMTEYNSYFLLSKVDTPEGKAAFYPDKDWDDLKGNEKHKIIASIHLYFAYKAWEQQVENIRIVLDSHWEPVVEHKFPYSSREIYHYYDYLDEFSEEEALHIAQNEKILWVFKYGFVDDVVTEDSKEEGYYSKLLTSSMPYAETYGNLYQYGVSQFYSIYTIIGIWSGLSLLFLGSSIIVYKKTDFK